MVLPYEERWEFVFGGPDFVRGHGGLVNVSVQILPDTWKDDATFLEEVKSGLLKNKGANGTINARITKFAGSQLVLSIADAEVVSKDPSFKDVKQYNYFATRLAGGSRSGTTFPWLSRKASQESTQIRLCETRLPGSGSCPMRSCTNCQGEREERQRVQHSVFLSGRAPR